MAFLLADRPDALQATVGALGVICQQDQTGEGLMIDVCLLDPAMIMVENPAFHYLDTDEECDESGGLPYEAADGWLVPVQTIPQVNMESHPQEREMLVKVQDPLAGEMHLPGLNI